VRIPRARSGVELSREEVTGERETLLAAIATALGEPVETIRAAIAPPEQAPATTVVGVIERLVLDDIRRVRRVRALSAAWGAKPGLDRKTISRALKLASQEIALMNQSRMLEATQRVFRYWHIAHMPFALTALLAVIIHVIVVVALGATWFW